VSLLVTLPSVALPKLTLLPNWALSNLLLLKMPPVASPSVTFILLVEAGASVGAL
jgi:hypothetical protein